MVCHHVLMCCPMQMESLSRVASCTCCQHQGCQAGLASWSPQAAHCTCQSMSGLPRILVASAAVLVPEDKELATRLHSQTMLNKLAPVIPGFWGGSAGEPGRTALQEAG